MRKDFANLVGMIMLSTYHWMRKNRIYSLLLLVFSAMLIISNTAQFVQIASATECSDQLENESDCEKASIQVTSACEPSPSYEIEKCITDVNCEGSKASVKEAEDVITYRIIVTNTGDLDLTNVAVKDPLIKTLKGPEESKDCDGVLDVGETWTYTGSYTVTQEDIDSNGNCDGYIDNVATVSCDQLDQKSACARAPIENESTGDDSNEDESTGDDSNEDESTGDDSNGDDSNGDDSNGDDSNGDDSNGDNSNGDDSTGEVPAEENPAYSINKSIIGVDEAGDSIINEAGDIIEYQIIVKNEGDSNLTGVAVSDLMVILTGPIGDDIDTGVLNPGETWEFVGNYTVTQTDITSNGGGDGFIENTASVSCNELPDKNSSVKQIINFSSTDSVSSVDTYRHHSDGGTGEARIIPKPSKSVEMNETDNETQLEPDVRNFDQGESAEANPEQEPEQNKAGIPGFEIVYGLVGLLAAIFMYKTK